MKAFVRDLMRRMTLDEKIGQLNLITPGGGVETGSTVNTGVAGKVRNGLTGGMFGVYAPGAVQKIQKLAVEESRLKIPLIFGLDVIHGHKTIFSIPLGLSCSWDMPLIEKSARIAAVEASADGLNWVFSPMVDIARDPRWGRIAESSGEDTYLGSRIAAAMVRGYQGDDLSRHDTVMSCVKHFVYGTVEGGKEYNSVDMSPIRMHETYLPPFKAAIKEGAGSIMTSFNDINGIPATAHKELVTQVLRKEWGFEGVVVTDYTGVNEMTAHGLGDLKTVSALALKAGIDMDMVGEGFLTTLKQSLAEGKVTEREIDQACRRILEMKYKLGLFDDPYKYLDNERAAKNILTQEHRQAAREIAARSFVLLKNDAQILPLKKTASIALVGPLADDRKNMLGTWSVAADWAQSVTVLEGIKNVVGDDAQVIYAKGANITNDLLLAKRLNFAGVKVEIDPRSPAEMIAEAVAAAEKSDLIVAVVGEAQEMSGECSSRSEIGIPEDQRDLLKALAATGKPLVLVLMNGRPLTLVWENEHATAILETWFGGTEAGNAIADVLFGDYNPSGKLTATFPRNVGQIPLYYNHKTTGRPCVGGGDDYFEKFKSCYLDVPNTPLYPFGYGLSYTSFAYSPVSVNHKTLNKKDMLKASVTVTNTGKYAGEEIVQLYITDPGASITRPVKDLKGFQKILLQPGEQKEITFEITTKDLKFYNTNLRRVWEPGEFIIGIGANSSDLQSATVNWTKDKAGSNAPKHPDVASRCPKAIKGNRHN
ncbi:MAG: beta-glucosidase BglX [Alphaproteobacteria bacterium]